MYSTTDLGSRAFAAASALTITVILMAAAIVPASPTLVTLA